MQSAGEHSIVIFVSCYGLIVVTARAVDALGLDGNIGWQTAIVTALTLGGGLFLQWALHRTPLKFLFGKPRWLITADAHLVRKNLLTALTCGIPFIPLGLDLRFRQYISLLMLAPLKLKYCLCSYLHTMDLCCCISG